MPDSFGARLRRKREEQQIALSAIAADTKIKLSLLEALERDDVSNWPTGLFRRAYVRAYARAVGLPQDDIVAEFIATFPEPDTSDLPLSASFPKSAEPDSWRERIWQFGRWAVQPDALPATTPAAVSPSPAAAVPISPPETTAAAEREPSAVDAATHEEKSPASVEAPAPATDEHAPLPAVVNAPDAPPFDPDLAAMAKVCTDLGQVANANDLVRVLAAAAELMNASGAIVWLWDRAENALVPAFTHGYPPRVLAHLQPISRDSDNATASAFRSGEVCVVNRSARQNGALVAPLLRTGGCIGVLALELLDGVEQTRSVGHVARVVAAQLATLFDAPGGDAGAEPTAAAGGQR